MKTGECFFNFEFKSGLKFDEANIHSIGFTISVIDIYEKASKMQFDSLDIVVEQYIKECLLDEIKAILDEAAEPIPEEDSYLY